MKGVSAFALFCEDIRRETGNKETLIGVMPETIQVSTFPGALKKLAVYFRVRLEVGRQYPKPIKIDLEIPGDDIQSDSKTPEPIPAEVIERSIERAKDRGLPYATIIGRMFLSESVPIPSPRMISAILICGSKRQLCGVLNIAQRPTEPSVPSEGLEVVAAETPKS